MEQFAFQFDQNQVYREYCQLLQISPGQITSYLEIPFLPIQLFKSRKVFCGSEDAEIIFTSSGTTGQVPSSHHVKHVKIYEDSFLKSFRYFYGNPEQYCFLCLLPSYLERSGSSLVYMAERLIELSKNAISGFFLHNHSELKITIDELKHSGQKTILFGVTYALMDLAECGVQLDDSFIVMETGGMKGNREELPKAAIHDYLKNKLGVSTIHSEYGMTELLSQAYSTAEGIFSCPPWMKVCIRDPYAPNEYLGHHKTGGINVIDLANIHSCSFIATQDLGRTFSEHQFELAGRFNEAELRGCNLLLKIGRAHV